MRPRGQTPRMRATGMLTNRSIAGFNEAAGADPADANVNRCVHVLALSASMRPRGQTPRMRPGSRLWIE